MIKKDVFISYASEQKETIAKPLYNLLSILGVSVWFDDAEIKVGDSIRQKLDDGLLKSEYGIIILSNEYLSKKWTRYELDSIINKETLDKNIIIPIWVGLSTEDVKKFSLELSGRKAIKWEGDIINTILQIVEKIKPGLIDKKNNKIITLKTAKNGRDVISLFENKHASYFLNCPLETKEQVNIVATFLENLNDYCEIWDEIEIGGKIEYEYNLDTYLKELDDNGFVLFIGSVNEPYRNTGVKFDCFIAFVGTNDITAAFYHERSIIYFK